MLVTFVSKLFIAFSLSVTSLAIALVLVVMLALAPSNSVFVVDIFSSKATSAAKALSFSVVILLSRTLLAWTLSVTSCAIALAFSFIEVLHPAISLVLATISSLALSNSERIAPTPLVISSTAVNLSSKTTSACLYSASTLPIEVSNPDFIVSTSTLV